MRQLKNRVISFVVILNIFTYYIKFVEDDSFVLVSTGSQMPIGAGAICFIYVIGTKIYLTTNCRIIIM